MDGKLEKPAMLECVKTVENSRIKTRKIIGMYQGKLS